MRDGEERGVWACQGRKVLQVFSFGCGEEAGATFQLFLRRDDGISVRTDTMSTWTIRATACRDRRWHLSRAGILLSSPLACGLPDVSQRWSQGPLLVTVLGVGHVKLVPGGVCPPIPDAFPFWGGLDCGGSQNGLPCATAGALGPARGPFSFSG